MRKSRAKREWGFLFGSKWEYDLDGSSSFLKSRVTGEQIFVDVPNGPDFMYNYEFPEFLRSNRKPSPVMARLSKLFPDGHGARYAIAYLREKQLFHVVDECDDLLVFELGDEIRPYLPAVRDFLIAWRQEANRPTLGAMIGDWDTVIGADIDPVALAHAEHHAELARQRWLSLLHFHAGGEHHGDLLYALAAANDECLPGYLSQALADPHLAATAIDIIGDDPAWRQEVEAATSALDLTGHAAGNC